MTEQEVSINVEGVELGGSVTIPTGASGLVIFAHGSGSSRHSPRNRFVAQALNEAGLATLLFDLLTEEEEQIDARSAELRFDIGFLAKRLLEVNDWAAAQEETAALHPGYFGSSTGGGATLVAAAQKPKRCGAIVSRGGRPDLAEGALQEVKAPTLLIVGARDEPVLGMNRSAMDRMQTEVKLETVPGATHLFEEAGALENVAALAAEWFKTHIG